MSRLIIVNLLGTAPHQSRTVVGEELLKRVASALPPEVSLTFAVSDERAWRAALGTGARIMTCGTSRLWGRRWYEALYVQLVLPLRAWRAATVFSVSPVFPVALLRKNVVMIHDCAYRRFPGEASLAARTYVRAMYRCAVWFARRIVTISNFSAREIEELYGVPVADIAVLPNSLPRLERVPDAKSRAAPFSGGAPFFLYVGITRFRKNIPTLLRAFASFAESDPETKLVMVGKQDARFLDVGAEARALGIEDRVVRAGFVSLEDKAALMQEAIALVLPSLYEGFALHVLEAQSMDLPVIAAGIPAVREVAGGAAALVEDPMDAAGFARAMAEVAGSEQLRRDLAERGRANVPRYSWERNVKTLAELLAG